MRRIKVDNIKIEDDSDVSSIDSNTDSLKSEDVFNGDLENMEDLAEDGNNWKIFQFHQFHKLNTQKASCLLKVPNTF